MADWNEQSAANNNIHSTTIRSSKQVGKKNEPEFHEFSEELSDGGIRDEMIQKQLKNQRQEKKAKNE